MKEKSNLVRKHKKIFKAKKDCSLLNDFINIIISGLVAMFFKIVDVYKIITNFFNQIKTQQSTSFLVYT